MTRKLPIFTVPLTAFGGLSRRTLAALDDLFGPGYPEGRLKALVLRSHNVVNSTDPHEVGFLFEELGGDLRVASGFKTPRDLMTAGAAAAYMLSHDPQAGNLRNAVSLTCKHGDFTRVAVTAFGAVAWAPRTCHAHRNRETDYQAKLDQGDAIIAMMATKSDRSAHQRIEDCARFGALAEAIYTLEMTARSKNSRTGLHRKVRFTLDGALRNPQIGPR